MKRHPALHDLARDHFHALVCAQRIRKATTDDELKEAAMALIKLWREDLVYHFREEEEVLLPVLSRHFSPSDDPDIRRMLDDHARLRDGFRRLCQEVDGDLDCMKLLKELGEQLEAHARLEDRIVFGRLESLLTESELQEVARLSAEFRDLWGRPTGPG
jgi:iron-sulfur cluster repair protein YtfE (RIC family)